MFSGEGTPPDGLDRFTVFGIGEMLAVEGRDDGRDLTVRVGGRDIVFSVGCFFQSNLGALQKLVPWALAGIAGETAADLYCGVGLFGAFLSETFSRILCVESQRHEPFLRPAQCSGRGPRVLPHDRRAVDPAPVSASSRADAVVVDPPRAGLGEEVRAWLIERTPPRLVYVSCNPVTLARDLAALVGGGYVLEDLRLFDFYPQTSHVEAVARLVHRGAA